MHKPGCRAAVALAKAAVQAATVVRFGTDSRQDRAARASCKDCAGDHAATGEGRTVCRLAGLMKACAPSPMQQQDRFVDLAKDTRRCEPTATEASVPHTGDGRTITARRT